MSVPQAPVGGWNHATPPLEAGTNHRWWYQRLTFGGAGNTTDDARWSDAWQKRLGLWVRSARAWDPVFLHRTVTSVRHRHPGIGVA